LLNPGLVTKFTGNNIYTDKRNFELY